MPPPCRHRKARLWSKATKRADRAALERAIAGGLATPALLAQVLVSKYCDHTPLYRQAQIFARRGVDLARPNPHQTKPKDDWRLVAIGTMSAARIKCAVEQTNERLDRRTETSKNEPSDDG